MGSLTQPHYFLSCPTQGALLKITCSTSRASGRRDEVCFLLADSWGLALVSGLLRKPWKAVYMGVDCSGWEVAVA